MARPADQALNIKLVQEVEKHPCLYNYTLNEYSRKDITENAWNDIGRELNLTGNECKDKWKNLRAVFVRHMKSAPSGSSKSKKPYYLTDAMQFALPYVKVLNSVTSVNLPKRAEEELCDDQEEENSDDSVPSIQSFAPETTLSPFYQRYSSSERKDNKQSKDNTHENFDEYFKLKKQKLEAGVSPVQEANKMFLLSLLPDMNLMSSHQTRIFKRKVIDLMDNILQDTPNILSPNSSISTNTQVSTGFEPVYLPIQKREANTSPLHSTEI